MVTNGVKALVLAVLIASTTANAQEDPQPPRMATQRVASILEQSGYKYIKHSASVWSINFKGEKRAAVVVLVLASASDLIVEGVIAEHDEVQNAADAGLELLKHADSVPDISFLIDQDDDYMARARLMLKRADVAAFKTKVQEVALATDEAYGVLQQYLHVAGPGGGVGELPEFGASAGATERVAFLAGKGALAFDPSKWKQTKSETGGKLNFQHISGDGYAMIIAERIAIPAEQFRDLAIANMHEVAPDGRVVEETRRKVNGADVRVMRLEGTAKGIAFTFLGYYYSGPAGSVQVVTYTGTALFDEYRADFEEFLNGLKVGK